MPKKHYLDFIILGLLGATPWAIWLFNQSSWAFGLGIGLGVISAAFMAIQAIGGIRIRKGTTLHFEVKEETGIARVWMHKPPPLWRNSMKAPTNRANIELADAVTFKKINGKPILTFIESSEKNILNIPYRLAHQPAVNSYLKEILQGNNKLSKEYIEKALSFLNEKDETKIVAEARY